MTFNYINYQLVSGYVHNWLVAGPVAYSPLGAEPTVLDDVLPVDLGPLTNSTGDPHHCTWRYYATRDDHFLDLTPKNMVPAHLCAWAYVQLHVPAVTTAKLTLTTTGHAEIKLNGHEPIHLDEREISFPQPRDLSGVLQAGANEIFIRFDYSTNTPLPYVLALEITSFSGKAPTIYLPTKIETQLLERRQILEQVVNHAYLDSYIYGYHEGDQYNRNQPITVHFPEKMSDPGEITLRLESLNGSIFQELSKSIVQGDVLKLANTFPLRNGAHFVSMTPLAQLYYKNLVRFDRRELIYVVRSPSVVDQHSDQMQRTQEALRDASEQRNQGIFCEIAKISLGQWERVNYVVLRNAITNARLRTRKSAVDLMGLLGLWLRCKSQHQTQLEVHKEALVETVTQFEYWPNYKLDSIGKDVLSNMSESLRLVLHTCEILAGQWLPHHNFIASGHTGEWHRTEGEKHALDWIKQCASYGTKDWGSPASVETILAALAHLAELAKPNTVSKMASVLMDKILFGLAVNSFRGADAGSKGASDTASLLSTRLAPTAGIHRMLWGLGNHNEHIIGTVSLATNTHYRMPEILRRIAADPIGAIWNQERHSRPKTSAIVEPDRNWEVNTTTYKTKDFILACAQDYHAGKSGHGEHIWQATLGPDAVVFVNHPVNFRDNDALLPNLWAGNGSLPRATQWGDVLVATYKLPLTDWLGFTHAYFPASAFDQYVVEGNWAFARKGEGYIALTASQGLTFIETGQTAFRELRSHGLSNTWVCHMGQKLLDGSFADFQHNCRALDLQWHTGGVQINTLRGERLRVGWQGPLLVNDVPQSVVLPENCHIQNPYTTMYFSEMQMDIAFQAERLRLKFL